MTITNFIEKTLKDSHSLFYNEKDVSSYNTIAYSIIISICGALSIGIINTIFTGREYAIYIIPKTILVFGLTLLLCYPSFFVITIISGIDINMKQSIQLICIYASLLSIIVLAFAPIIRIFSNSTNNIYVVSTLNGIIIMLSMILSFFMFQKTINQTAKINMGMIIWFIIFFLVLMQSSITFGNIIGDKSVNFVQTEKRFFLQQ